MISNVRNCSAGMLKAMSTMEKKEEKNNPKILIVDDNIVNIKILSKMLKLNNYTNIITTTNPCEVCELYEKQKPDLMLLDLKMPVCDGFHVMERLFEQEDRECTPIIMITAQDDKENRMKALEMGVRDFIGKPFDQNELIVRIKNTLKIKIRHNDIKKENKTLNNLIISKNQKIEMMQFELISRLVKAAESRDNNTGDHINRIGLYTRELSKMMGMDKDFIEKIEYASMMHDIGKIGIPDHILLKKGKLSQEEKFIMEEHTQKGAQLLSGSDSEILKMGEIIALTHHEMWNGEGYPNKISGEKIPVEGRITTICDVFDALMSSRPYKKAWNIDETYKEIEKEIGIRFDPEIAVVFLDNISRFYSIKAAYNKE